MVVADIKNFSKQQPIAAGIGYFDSIHLGHQELLRTVVAFAKANDCLPTVITFDCDPAEVISGREVKQFNTFAKRLKRFAELGIETVLLITFDRTVASLSPVAFIDNYLKPLNLQYLVCGFDFSFGHKGLGNSELLRNCCPFRVEVIPEIQINHRKVATTWLKECVERADFATIAFLLKCPYSLLIDFDRGEIIDADRLLLPPDGKYPVRLAGGNSLIEIKGAKTVMSEGKISGIHEVIFE